MAAKRQIPLRLSEKLYNAIAAWAEDDFRSVNGQIEYLLTECVKQRKKNGKYVGEEIDAPLELDGAAFGDGYPTPEQQAIIDEMMTIPEGTVPDDPLDFLPGRQRPPVIPSGDG